mgnify:CR=1 FL=1
MPWQEIKICVDYRVRSLCVKPYYNHPSGCPNFGKRDNCPPNAPRIKNTIDLNREIYAIWNIFDFKNHCNKIREKHLNWSQRQIECCLWWQPTARKQLKKIIKDFQKIFPNLKVIELPEAQGVDLTEIMKSIGIKLEYPPKNITYQIVLAGHGK